MTGEALLGLATTEELLDELGTRFEVHGETAAEKRAARAIELALAELPERALRYRTVDS